MKLLRILYVSLVVCSNLCAAAVPAFQNGDHWCAIGDSITHGGNYHRYVYLFYATRFPEKSIEFFNCGISGDTAAGALRRLDGDVLRHQPSVATIMLGMNDVNRGLYEEGQGGAEVLAKREKAIATHFANMHSLAEKLQAAGAKLIFITPSIYDETVVMQKPNAVGVNGALGQCAENAKKLAEEFHGSLVDFYGSMNELNLREQKANPEFTIVGADRIHPGEVGHFVMATLFLKAQGAPQFVADMSVDAAGKDKVEFTKKEDALPFPVPAGCLPALKLVPFMEELNQERLRVGGLPTGSYKLSIDGTMVSTFTSEELGAGVNLATFSTTPQYKQALAVAKLDEQRHEIVKRLRVIDYVEWKMGRQIGDPTEFDYGAGAQQMLADPKITGWPRDRVQDYLKIKPEEQILRKKLAELVAAIRQESVPKEHQFLITR